MHINHMNKNRLKTNVFLDTVTILNITDLKNV